MGKIDEQYLELVNQLLKNGLRPVKNTESLFTDRYQTKEQIFRDEQISNLLKEYVDRFKRKSKETLNDRNLLKWVSIIGISLLTLTIIVLTIYVVVKNDVSSTESLAAIITALVTLCGSLFGIINYVAKRAFPTDDEKYITEIVKLIQENDLKHKQENIKAAKDTAMMIVEHNKEGQATASYDLNSSFTPIS